MLCPSAAVAGPGLPAASVTTAAASRGMTVPSVGPDPATVTVHVVPEPVTAPTVQPVLVPWKGPKLPVARPVTDSEKTSV